METERRLQELTQYGRVELRKQWQSLFKKPAPKRMSVSMLRRFIAFEIEARAAGCSLEQLARNAQKSAVQAASRRSDLAPGTRLLREWHGTTHCIEVTQSGFSWQGKTYGSLSAVAHAITAAHWSGPRFFGLRKRHG